MIHAVTRPGRTRAARPRRTLRIPDQASSRAERPDGQLLEAHARRAGRRSRARSCGGGSLPDAAGGRCRGRRSRCARGAACVGRGYGYRRRSAPMHVVLADPPAVHAAVRPRARGCARPRRRRGRARHVAVPLRRAPAAGRLRAGRGASIRARAGSGDASPALGAEGGSSIRSGCAGCCARRRTCSTCSGSRRRSSTSRCSVHGRRSCSPRTTSCRGARRGARALWRRLFGALRPRRRPLRARAGALAGVRRRPGGCG